MKTLTQIQNQLNVLINSRTDLEKEAKEIDSEKNLKKARKNAQILTECKYYLETNPSEAFIKTQIDFNKKKIKQINEGFEEWKNTNKDICLKQPDPTRLLAIYHSEMGRTKINFQLKVLNFLLD